MHLLREWVLAIALYIALLIDGAMAFYLHQFLTIGDFRASATLLPIGIMVIALVDDINKKEIWLALGAGLVADIASLGLIGVYTVFLPLLCWLCQKIARFLPEIFWARLLVVVLGLALLDVYIWGVLTMVGLTNASIKILLLSLLYNLFWSLILFTASYWLWVGLAQDYPFLNDLSVYR